MKIGTIRSQPKFVECQIFLILFIKTLCMSVSRASYWLLIDTQSAILAQIWGIKIKKKKKIHSPVLYFGSDTLSANAQCLFGCLSFLSVLCNLKQKNYWLCKRRNYHFHCWSDLRYCMLRSQKIIEKVLLVR